MENCCLKCGEVFGRFEERYPYEDGYICSRCHQQEARLLCYEIIDVASNQKDYSLEGYSAVASSKDVPGKDYPLDAYDCIAFGVSRKREIKKGNTSAETRYDPISDKMDAYKEYKRKQRKRDNALRNTTAVIACIAAFSLLALLIPKIVDLVQEYQQTGTVVLFTEVKNWIAHQKELFAGYISFLKFR